MEAGLVVSEFSSACPRLIPWHRHRANAQRPHKIASRPRKGPLTSAKCCPLTDLGPFGPAL